MTDDSLAEIVARLDMLLDRSRAWRIAGYLAILLAGVSSFMTPSRVLEQQSNSLLVYTCSTIWVLGSAISLVSSIRDRMWGERFAIPLIAAALAGFAVALFANGTINAVTFAYGFFFVGFASFLADRWYELRALLEGREMVDRVGEGPK